ncbi:MAG: hypothetical protein ACK4UK_03435 [Flavobacterium sp.]
MKKILFLAVAFFATNFAFANFDSISIDDLESKEVIENFTDDLNVEVVSGCCTATLYHNGQYVDHQTICGMPTMGGNCRMATEQLLDRHPPAKKALSAE